MAHDLREAGRDKQKEDELFMRQHGIRPGQLLDDDDALIALLGNDPEYDVWIKPLRKKKREAKAAGRRKKAPKKPKYAAGPYTGEEEWLNDWFGYHATGHKPR